MCDDKSTLCETHALLHLSVLQNMIAFAIIMGAVTPVSTMENYCVAVST
jgi:hypothetical protein